MPKSKLESPILFIVNDEGTDRPDRYRRMVVNDWDPFAMIKQLPFVIVARVSHRFF
jgi:hypothetical protein